MSSFRLGIVGLFGTLLMTALQGCRAGADALDIRARALWVSVAPAEAGGKGGPCTIIRPSGHPEPESGWPAIVFLHGRGECGADGIRSCINGLPPAVVARPERWPAVIIVPQKPEQRDTWAQHEAHVMACLERASQEFRIDGTRVYLTGLSQGGAGTWEIGSRRTDVFAAIAPVCGFVHDPAGAPSGTVTVGGENQRRQIAGRLAAAGTPIWTFHGEKDDAVLPEQTRMLAAAVEAAGGSVRATYLPEANHNAWDAAYGELGAELAAWVLSKRLAGR